jgi:anti-anti-sigma factor
MQAELKAEQETAVIQLKGRFDFGGHRDFKRCYEGAFAQTGVRNITIDLKNVDYVDSAALGMLLLLKQQADKRTVPVTLLDCAPMVKEIFDVANFDQIFDIR